MMGRMGLQWEGRVFLFLNMCAWYVYTDLLVIDITFITNTPLEMYKIMKMIYLFMCNFENVPHHLSFSVSFGSEQITMANGLSGTSLIAHNRSRPFIRWLSTANRWYNLQLIFFFRESTTSYVKVSSNM